MNDNMNILRKVIERSDGAEVASGCRQQIFESRTPLCKIFGP